MSYSIIGAGLCGCTLASLLPNSILYERDKVGGLSRDNKNYQDFIHILHTDSKVVWDFVNCYTTVTPHSTILKSYVNGVLKPYPPYYMTDDAKKEQIEGYSKKMWLGDTPKEAVARITTSSDGLIFHNKYEGVPDFTRLFKNLTKGTKVIKQNIKDGDLDGKIILTGAIDEYFDYCYGELPYRGMQSVHYESEIGLESDYLTFSDIQVPFQRIVDYSRLGYEGQWLGIEIATNKAKHYPVLDDQSGETYSHYKDLADSKGVILCGRLATYHYMNMDEIIIQAMETVRNLDAD